jgi:hypothetical protein
MRLHYAGKSGKFVFILFLKRVYCLLQGNAQGKLISFSACPPTKAISKPSGNQSIDCSVFLVAPQHFE